MNPFGSLGVWLGRHLPEDLIVDVGGRAEELGYDTIWIGGGGEPGVFDLVENVLARTERVAVATGIVNIWVESPASVTQAWQRLEDAYPGRLYVGLGISHARLVEGLNLDYSRPLGRTREFLDALDEQSDPLPPDRRLLAALGPKMLALAAERSLGTHPYLVSTDNTAAARVGVGPEKVVAPELGVVLDPDLASARTQARDALSFYVGLPNYSNNWKRAGFGDADLAGGGSDRLIDALIALGDADAIAERVAAHRAAGADHVCLQVLNSAADARSHVEVLRALSGAR